VTCVGLSSVSIPDALVHSPVNVALHLPTLLTLKTACGSHHSSNTSSGEKVGAVELDAGGSSASFKMDVLIWTRASWVPSVDTLGIRWKAYGRGSSVCMMSAGTRALVSKRQLTSPLSLFTSICRASRPVSAGRLIAGPRFEPSSEDLNWTTIDGAALAGAGKGSGLSDRS
jgi:hypothetical protein